MIKLLLTLVILSSCVTRPEIISEGVKVVDDDGEKHFYEEINMVGVNYCLVHQEDEVMNYKAGKN